MGRNFKALVVAWIFTGWNSRWSRRYSQRELFTGFFQAGERIPTRPPLPVGYSIEKVACEKSGAWRKRDLERRFFPGWQASRDRWDRPNCSHLGRRNSGGNS